MRTNSRNEQIINRKSTDNSQRINRKLTDLVGNNPKDPTVLKLLRHSKFTTRSKFTIAQGFTMATTPALTQLSWVLQAFFPSQRGSRRTVRIF